MVVAQLGPVVPLPQLGARREAYMIAPASPGIPKSELVFENETLNEHPFVDPVPIVVFG